LASAYAAAHLRVHVSNTGVFPTRYAKPAAFREAAFCRRRENRQTVDLDAFGGMYLRLFAGAYGLAGADVTPLSRPSSGPGYPARIAPTRCCGKCREFSDALDGLITVDLAKYGAH
jgi:hypothetical protein